MGYTNYIYSDRNSTKNNSRNYKRKILGDIEVDRMCQRYETECSEVTVIKVDPKDIEKYLKK